MTVCLAALCQDERGSHAVVAADRMVTLPGFIEFEHAVPKMTEASSFAVAMPAGDALVGAQIARRVAASLSGSPTVEEIAQSLASEFDAARLSRMEQQILLPRALDVETFYESHGGLSPQIVAMLDNMLAQYNLGVELLVAGVDATGGHVYTVFHPGSPHNVHDTIGYAAVGSGWIHAIQAFIGFRQTAEADYHEDRVSCLRCEAPCRGSARRRSRHRYGCDFARRGHPLANR